MAPHRMDRRAFLARAAAASAAVSALGLSGCGGTRPSEQPPADSGSKARLDRIEWRVMEAAQARLLPSGPDSPGAIDIRATAYLDAALAEPTTDPADRARVRAGAAALDEHARARGAAHFAALTVEMQDTVLAEWLETLDGRAWFDPVMTYTMEALLGDPVHGGNPDGVAWTWLRVRPPYPRPAA